jgi:hypothetical protein
MGAPAIFEKQIEIKLLHSASTEGVTDSGFNHRAAASQVARIELEWMSVGMGSVTQRTDPISRLPLAT